MTHALTILATIVAAAVLAAPALAGTSKPPPRGAAGYTHMEQIEWLKAPQKKGATNMRTVAVDRTPLGFIFDLSL
jgi:hypothetical protein